MSMPIQRQSEQFGAFDDGPRWARDRGNRDLPAGIAALVNTSGARIQGGMLNTRTAGWNYPEWDKTEVDYDYEDPRRIVPTRAEAEADEAEDDDWDDHDHSLENHDPERFIPGDLVDPREAARRRASHRPFDRTAACLACGGELTPSQGGFYHTDDEGADEDHEPSPDEDDEVYAEESGQDYDPAAAYDAYKARMLDDAYRRGSIVEAGWSWEGDDDDDEDEDDVHYVKCTRCDGLIDANRVPFEDPPGSTTNRWGRLLRLCDGCVKPFMDSHPKYKARLDASHERLRNRFNRNGQRTAAAPVRDPAAMAPVAPAGGGFVPAHRVGLPWRDRVIKGTVIGLDGDAVAVRWDDGQYSSEEPRNVHLL